MAPRVLDHSLGKDPDYKFVEIIGRGAFGVVSKVKRVTDGQVFACKSIHCSSEEDLSNSLLSRELATWTAIGKEQYIAEYHDSSWATETLTVRVYMNLYPGGDLQKVIDTAQHQGFTVHPIVVTACAYQIAKGLQTCQKSNIIHRDLKPANILLSVPFDCNELLWKATNEDGPLAKEELFEVEGFIEAALEYTPWCHISDFGFSKFSSHLVSDSRRSLQSFAKLGTPGFIAPETASGSGTFSSESDIYSFGCILYYLCEGRLPFTKKTSESGYKPISTAYPPALAILISRCLAPSPTHRPNIDDILQYAGEFHQNAVNRFLDAAKGHKLPYISEATQGIGPSPPSPILDAPVSQPAESSGRSLNESMVTQEPQPALQPQSESLCEPNSSADWSKMLLAACEKRNRTKALALLRTGASSFVDFLSGTNILHIASSEGLVSVVDALIRKFPGLSLNMKDPDGYTALSLAARFHEIGVVECLIGHGADIEATDRDGRTAFLVACYGEDLPMMKLLHREGARLDCQSLDGSTALHYAVLEPTSKLVAITRWLLENGANQNIRNESGNLPIHDAVLRNLPETIRILVQWGADLEDVGWQHLQTPLVRAITYGTLEAFVVLIELGCVLKTVPQPGYGVNLLHAAVKKRRLDVMTMIFNHDPDCLYREDIKGWTALHHAVKLGYEDMVAFLVERGANPHIEDRFGITPYQLSKDNSQMERLLSQAVS
ncbi:hypothetical protein H072_380 [Dactylellina haptotyla CBS 200.50]|uniref:Protein kinase domain-containing protein n=1 Tax=Dactylellina haptotyla (strain CBS 200.50) TaxID=1284197 RepID=S8C1L3_DACHA|nr:hypothetical protein H072_380 [Dactylellina haptotyla CBS 200.50]